jgi:hypothetical protein
LANQNSNYCNRRRLSHLAVVSSLIIADAVVVDGFAEATHVVEQTCVTGTANSGVLKCHCEIVSLSSYNELRK